MDFVGNNIYLEKMTQDSFTEKKYKTKQADLHLISSVPWPSYYETE